MPDARNVRADARNVNRSGALPVGDSEAGGARQRPRSHPVRLRPLRHPPPLASPSAPCAPPLSLVLPTTLVPSIPSRGPPP
eukprot:488509-Prorocentrum_minimum.AAC.1